MLTDVSKTRDPTEIKTPCAPSPDPPTIDPTWSIVDKPDSTNIAVESSPEPPVMSPVMSNIASPVST